jgi:hypothetical protein
MKAMSSLNSALKVAALALILTGCKTYEVNPGSERVRVLDAEPKGCLYMGEVASVQEDRTVGTLETEMDLSTRVDLRNKAHALGGNILVFLKGKNSNMLPGSTPAGKAQTKAATSSEPAPDGPSAPPEKDALVFLATVFKCPSSVLNQ